MNVKGLIRELLLVLSSAFIMSLIIDIIFYEINKIFQLSMLIKAILKLVWGILRMYTPTLGVTLLALARKESIKGKLVNHGLRIQKVKDIIWRLIGGLVSFLALAICYVLLNVLGYHLAITSFKKVPLWLVLILGYFAGISINTLYALGEEICWRGYLLDVLEKRTNLIVAAIIIGVIWCFWHSSAIILLGLNYPKHRVEGVFLFLLFTIPLSVTLCIARRISNNVFMPAAIHGTINAVWGILYFSDVPYYLGSLGLCGFITWCIVSIIMYAVFKILTKRSYKV